MRSLWLQEALGSGFEPQPPLRGRVRADVCVVGGGYTGLWTAIVLKQLEPSLDVAVIERDICGSGASGRNGGFVLSWWAKFRSLAKIVGSEEALRLCRAAAAAVADIGAFCAANAIDAHFRPDGWLWAATNEAQMGAWRETVADLERHGEFPFRELSTMEVTWRTGSPRHLGGVLEASAATVQPAELVLGLRRVALDRGVWVFERSQMHGLDATSTTGRIVRTDGGSVVADRAVLALNAWGVRLRELRTRILVIGSDMVATPPVPDRLGEIGWTDGLCISDSRLLVQYYRLTRDGRLVFGKGGGALALRRRIGRRFEGESPRWGRTEAAMRSLYPSLGDVPVVADWTGPIDRSRDGLPFFGRLGGRPDVVYGAGYSGNGVGPSYLGGRILAAMALGLRDEWSGCGLVDRHPKRFPPQPIRFVGGAVVRAGVERTERAEDAGRSPGRVSRALVRLAPAGLVPVTERG